MSEVSNEKVITLLANNFEHPFVENIFKRHDIKIPEASASSCEKLAACHELVTEIRYDGSNTFFNIIGRTPVNYDEIAKDVADKIGVKTHNIISQDGIEYEELALRKIVEDKIDKLSEEERKKYFKSILEEYGKEYNNSGRIVVESGAQLIATIAVSAHRGTQLSHFLGELEASP